MTVRFNGTHRDSVKFQPTLADSSQDLEPTLASCKEIISLTRGSAAGGVVSFKKDHRVEARRSSPIKLNTTGSGTWNFDRKAGWPQSLNYQYQSGIDLQSGPENVSLSVKIQLLSEAKLKQHLAQRTQIQAEQTNYLAENQKQLDEAKLQRELPLTAEVKSCTFQTIAEKFLGACSTRAAYVEGSKRQILRGSRIHLARGKQRSPAHETGARNYG